MPSSQVAASERRNDRTATPHEPPKLKTTLKTPPKQATNPLQFVKVGPCSLYRSAQEQLQKVQETKKIKQEVRDDPEDWQSNLDNWKSSRRKRQEHIIERVVEVKKLELEEHDRQRRRSKTFSEMMEERGNRGRKLSMSLAMYHEEDANDLSDLGIGTSSGKSSVSGDTHDDTQSVTSDRDSEIEKNQSDVENSSENNNEPESKNESSSLLPASTPPPPPAPPSSLPPQQDQEQKSPMTELIETSTGTNNNNNNNKTPTTLYDNEFRSSDSREYDSGNTATASSPEPEEYTYEGAIRGYVSRVSQNIPRRSLMNLEASRDPLGPKSSEEKTRPSCDACPPAVKVDVLKRREIFERASRNSHDETRANNINIANNNNNSNNNNGVGARATSEVGSIGTRLSSLERGTREDAESNKEARAASRRLSGDMSSIRERLTHLEKQTSERENKAFASRKTSSAELERSHGRERITEILPVQQESSSLRIADDAVTTPQDSRRHDADDNDAEKTNDPNEQCSLEDEARVQLPEFSNTTISERSSSPESEYRSDPITPRAAFHRSLDSLDQPSDGHDNFARVQSLEELDYTTRYPPSSSSAELLNDLTDREDSGIHTADVSCSVSQADEPVDEEVLHHHHHHNHPETIHERQEILAESSHDEPVDPPRNGNENVANETSDATDRQRDATAVTIEDTADTTTSASGIPSNSDVHETRVELRSSRKLTKSDEQESCQRPIVYQSPRVPRRKAQPEMITRETEARSDESTNASTKKSNTPETKRLISKIPTPLPRKNFNARTNSPNLPVAPKFTYKAPSKIPSSTMKTPSEDSGSSLDRQSEHRRTVVEICEKIVLSSADLANSPPVTPFVTVSSYTSNPNNEESSSMVDNPNEKSTDSVDRASSQPMEPKQRQICETQEDGREAVSRPVPVAAVRSSPSSNLTLSGDDASISVSRNSSSPSHENIVEIILDSPLTSKQIPQLNLTSDEELVTGLTFPLGPPTSVEPPKGKPPPPPTDLTDDEDNVPIEPLKRLNSTRRIKKELRTRRSDFLGIEGTNDDYLERELTLTKPPDMAAILAEERRVEQLNRRSYDTDSNYERDSSHERDSGVELGHAEDWRKQPVSPDMSEHSRQSSEPFGASVTSSEEDEITKKEREIIEVLEKEEQWRYGNNREQNSDIGEKLAHKLRELEEEKMQLERERAQESEVRRRQEEIARKKEEDALREEMEQREAAAKRALDIAKRLEEHKIRDEECLRRKAEEIRIQENIEAENERRIAAEAARRQDDTRRSRSQEINKIKPREQMTLANRNDDDFASGEVLRVERELLQLEQEELKRRRTSVAYRQQRQLQLAGQLQEQWQSLQDVAKGANTATNINNNNTIIKNNSPRCNYQASVANSAPVNYRSSMPNLWLQENQRRRPPPPPVPPSKPSRLVEQMHRDVTIRNSRIPSADSIPQQIEGERLARGGSTSTLLSSNAAQQMTKQTLQALSAVPRSRIVKGDEWVQRRKSDVPRGTSLEYNYQHWLIQEAEQRRINEKNQRSVVTRKSHQQHVIGTSVPYNAAPQSSRSEGKPLPDSIIQTLTQRVQNRAQERPPPPPPPPQRRRPEQSSSHEHPSPMQHQTPQHAAMLHHQKVHQFANNADSQEKMLSVSGKKKCSHCGDELGRGAAMIIESLRLFYHMECFKCCVCHVRLGDGLMGTDVRVRNHKLHCHNCYSSDDGVKFSCV